MKAVVTICSRKKNESSALLPAKQRYVGEHIAKTEKIAQELVTPFFILSGKYGLLSADEKIQNYDYYLESEAVDGLGKLVATQLQMLGITEIDFYTEGKESWAPYEKALLKGSELSGTTLTVHSF